MTNAPKVKLSLTLSADLVALVDRSARATGATRSGVVDSWLRRAASAQAANAVHDATVEYYRSLSESARAEDDAWSSAATRAAAHVRYDDVVQARPRRGKRR